jgi:hypothetical protein
MSAICPVYPKQQTFQDPVGTSYLGHEPTSAFLMFANPAVTIALSLVEHSCWSGAYHPPAFIAAQCAGTLVAHGEAKILHD